MHVRDGAYMSGSKTPPPMNGQDALGDDHGQLLALSDIKLNLPPQQSDQTAFAFGKGRNGDAALAQAAHGAGHFGSRGSKGRLS